VQCPTGRPAEKTRDSPK